MLHYLRMLRLDFLFVLCLRSLGLLFFENVFIDSIWKCVMIYYSLWRLTVARLIFQNSLNWSEVLSSSGFFVKIWSGSELRRLINESLVIRPANCAHPTSYSWVFFHKLLVCLLKRRYVVFNWSILYHILLFCFFCIVGWPYICKGIITVHKVLLSLKLESAIVSCSALTIPVILEVLLWSAFSLNRTFCAQVSISCTFILNKVLRRSHILRFRRFCFSLGCLLLCQEFFLTRMYRKFVIYSLINSWLLDEEILACSELWSLLLDHKHCVIILEVLLDWVRTTSIGVYFHFGFSLHVIKFVILNHADLIDLAIGCVWSHHVLFFVVSRGWNRSAVIVSHFVCYNLVLSLIVNIMLAHDWVTASSRS